MKKNFDKKNKIAKLYDELFNFNFRMRKFNKQKTFDEFFFRFNNFVISFKLNEIFKIKTLKNKLIERMRFRMSHLKMCTN